MDASKKFWVSVPNTPLTTEMPLDHSRLFINNVHVLNGTIKVLDVLAKLAQRARQNAYLLDDWELLLTHIKMHAKDLVPLILL